MLSTTDKRVIEIQQNNNLINAFIQEYKPFIISYCNKTLHKYLDISNDDEYSIALMAFYEAINSYNINKGSFLPYSQRVIKLRLIDHYRKNKKYSPSSSLDTDIDNCNELINQTSLKQHTYSNYEELLRLEIKNLTSELESFDITFTELIKASPKWKSTRIKYNEILSYIIKNELALKEFIITKRMPILLLEKNLKIPRKTIERSRKYIIAVLLIMLGDYEHLKSYITLEV